MTWKDDANNTIAGYLEGAHPTNSEEHAQLVIYIRDLLAENAKLLKDLQTIATIKRKDSFYDPDDMLGALKIAEQAINRATKEK